MSQIEQLRQAGVEAEVLTETDENSDANQRPVHCLVVDAIDETKAKEVLNQRMVDDSSESLIHCPSCGSFFLEYPGRPRDFPSVNLVSEVMEKIGEIANLNVKAFSCHECGMSFSPAEVVTGPPEARRDQAGG